MKRRTPKWLRWQRGQALVEYWPTIPAGIMLMLSAGLLVQWISGGLLTTVDALNPVGFECDDTPEYPEDGDTVATPLGDHEIILKSVTESDDRTTIVYTVTNSADPAISNWLLGLPPAVRDRILSTSEPYEEVDSDPHYGAGGIKFETGYGGGGGGKPKKTWLDGYSLVGYSPRATVESRDVIITLAGYYEWGMVEVYLKAGTETYHNTITGPLQMREPEEGECEATS